MWEMAITAMTPTAGKSVSCKRDTERALRHSPKAPLYKICYCLFNVNLEFPRRYYSNNFAWEYNRSLI